MQDTLWNQGIIKKTVLALQSALLYSLSACKNGITVLKTSVHSKLKQLPVNQPWSTKTHPDEFFKIYWQMEIL